MSLTAYVFFVSLAGLLLMGASKWVSLRTSRQGFFSFLSRFDASLGAFLVRLSSLSRMHAVMFWNRLVILSSAVRHALTVHLHESLRRAEEKVRAWREFARERKFERKSPSGFIQNVFEYKNQLKRGGDEQ